MKKFNDMFTHVGTPTHQQEKDRCTRRTE